MSRYEQLSAVDRFLLQASQASSASQQRQRIEEELEEEEMLQEWQEMAEENPPQVISMEKVEEEYKRRITGAALEKVIEIVPLGLGPKSTEMDRILAFQEFIILDTERRSKERLEAMFAEARTLDPSKIKPPKAVFLSK